jgi:hypothetical protein
MKLHTLPPLRALSAACLLAMASALATSPALAATDADLIQLREQIKELREGYEARLRALEERVLAAEAATRATPATPAATPVVTPTATAEAPTGRRDNRFNPAVSLVLSGTYAHLQQDAEGKGLSLGESEITFSANIDPWWYGSMTMAVTPEDEVEVEEAYVQTTALSHGLSVKAGRFFSGLGYLNEQHAHVWDFIDAPLAYEALLDGRLGQDGVQVKWLAPTDQYLQFGAEVGRGASLDNGVGNAVLFAKLGGDVGDSHSWQVGASHLWQRGLATGEEEAPWDGRQRTWALDGVWKWAPMGNAKVNHFKLQGEYFRGDRGELGDASGWYLQGVYQFAPGWKVGLRQEQPKRSSVMLDWALSEFSRWRIQFNHDRSRPEVSDRQWYLQYQMNLGAHGAHGF